MKYNIKSTGGSITVESALVVPIVILTVMIVIFITLIIYQTCIMQAAANRTAEKAADLYSNQSASFARGVISKDDIVNLGLYRRWGSNSNNTELKSFALEMLNKNSVLKSQDTQISVEQSNIILARGVTVQLTAVYNNPLGDLTAIWGLGRKVKLKVWSKACVDDPVEFIRNTDYILETAARVPIINELENKWQQIVNRIIEYVNSIAKEKKSTNE